MIGVPLVLLAATGSVAYAEWSSSASPDSTHASAAVMPTGAKPTTTATGSTVTVSWAARTLLGTTITVDGYRIVRYDAAGVATPATDGCAGLLHVTACTEAGVPDGAWQYAVQPAWGASWVGPVGPKSEPITVSTVGIAFPEDGGNYGIETYAGGCGTPAAGDLCGTATAGTGRGITAVRASLRRGSAGYWNPDAQGFTSTTEVLVPLGNGTSWSMPVAITSFPAAGPYTLRVEAVDSVGRVSSTSATFTAYPAKPAPPTISGVGSTSPTNLTSATFALSSPALGATYRCVLDGETVANCPGTLDGLSEGQHSLAATVTDGGGNVSDPATRTWTVDTTAPTTASIRATPSTIATGKISAGDQLALTYSEPMSPGTLVPGWNGNATKAIKLRVTRGSPDEVTFLDAIGKPIAALGTVRLGGAGYVSGSVERIDIPATLALAGGTVTVTVGAIDAAAGVSLGTGPAGLASWTPDGGTDLAGNTLNARGLPVLEDATIGSDRDF